MSAVPLAAEPAPRYVAERIVGSAADTQPALPLASDGVMRWVWQGRFGAMLIEVIGSEVFVNGERVEPHAP